MTSEARKHIKISVVTNDAFIKARAIIEKDLNLYKSLEDVLSRYFPIIITSIINRQTEDMMRASMLCCKTVSDTTTRNVNDEFEICMQTILHWRLNYYKDHQTSIISLLSNIPPLAIINKAYPSFRPFLDYYPRKIESITPRRTHYIDIVTAEAQTLLLVEKSLSSGNNNAIISFTIQFAKL